MARGKGNPGTVRGGRPRGSKPKDAGSKPRDAGGGGDAPPRTPAASGAAGGGGGPKGPGEVFDLLAQTHRDFKEMMGGAEPDLTLAVQSLVDTGIDPQTIVNEMGSRGVDVSRFLENVTPAPAATPTPAAATPEAPPNNLPAADAAPVEAVNNLPEPPAPERPMTFDEAYAVLSRRGMSEDDINGMDPRDVIEQARAASPPAEAAPSAAAAAPVAPEPPAAQAAAPALQNIPMAAAEGFPSPRHIAQLEENGFDPSTMSPQEMFDTYQSLVEQGYIRDSAAATPQPDAQQVADSLRTPIMDAIVRASDPNAMPGSPQPASAASIQDQLRMFSGQTRLEDAYRILSDAGIPDSVLARMDNEQMARMAAFARSPQAAAPTAGLTAADAPPASPEPSRLLESLRDQRAAEASVGEALFPPQYRQAAAEAAAGDALFPPEYARVQTAPPPPEPAATTSPVAGLAGEGAATAPPQSAMPGPLELPRTPNFYDPSIYTQLQTATFNPRVVEQYSPPVTPQSPYVTPGMEMPEGFAGAAGDPRMQVRMPEMGSPQPIPEVMDVGSSIPTGVGPAGNAPPPAPPAPPAPPSRGARLVRTLLGTPAEGDKPAQLGMLNPAWAELFNAPDGGRIGQASRALTSPRTVGLIALYQYLKANGGLMGQGSPVAAVGRNIMVGEDGQQNSDEDAMAMYYATNPDAAMQRLARPRPQEVPQLSLPMVPNADRPSR